MKCRYLKLLNLFAARRPVIAHLKFPRRGEKMINGPGLLYRLSSTLRRAKYIRSKPREYVMRGGKSSNRAPRAESRESLLSVSFRM